MNINIYTSVCESAVFMVTSPFDESFSETSMSMRFSVAAFRITCETATLTSSAGLVPTMALR
jgi:hypothetical protein